MQKTNSYKIKPRLLQQAWLILFLVITSFYSKAQFTRFNKNYPVKETNITYDIIEENDTSFIVKSAFVDSSSHSGLALFKIDSKGIKHIQKNFYFLDSSQYTTFGLSITTTNRMVKTSASSFFVLNGYVNKYNKQSIIITKHNVTDLDTVFIKLIGDSVHQYDAEQCKLLPDGNIMIIGFVYNDTNLSIPEKTLLTKIDTLGNILWQNSFSLGTVDCNGFSVEYNTTTHGYIVLGQKILNALDVHGFVATTDSVGNLINSTILGAGSYSSFFPNLAPLPNGDFIICGIVSSVYYSQYWLSQPYLAKINSAGSVLWQKNIYSAIHSGAIAEIIDIVTLNNGEFLACGDYAQTPYEGLNDSAVTGLIMKIDANGNILWQKSYNAPLNVKSCRLETILKTSDTTFLVGGSYDEQNANVISTAGWIISIDSAGCDTLNCSNFVGIQQIVNNIEQITVYPNPASNKININTNDITEIKEISLYDVLGNKIISTQQKEIDVSNINDGVYFLNIKTNQGLSIKKIIIQH